MGISLRTGGPLRRAAAIFGTVARFAETFTEAIVVTPRRLHA